MAVSREKKAEILEELKTMFGNAKSVAFTQYSGMSVAEITALRKAMRDAGAEFKVAKKTLLKLAAKEHGLELPDEIMEGTIGAVFSYDDFVSGPKLVKQTAKDIEVVKLLGGVMEGKVLSISEMGELASMPSKEELLAKFVGLMRAPLQNFYGLLGGPTSAMARALTAYAEQLPAETAAPEAAEEEAAPAAEDAPAEEAAADDAAEEAAE